MALPIEIRGGMEEKETQLSNVFYSVLHFIYFVIFSNNKYLLQRFVLGVA